MNSLRFSTLLILSLSIFVAGCETKLDTDDLRIVNSRSLPRTLVFYNQVDIPIEVAGGQGGYRVRYLTSKPENLNTDDSETRVANYIELDIVKDDTTQKNTFRLTGVPYPLDGAGGDVLETQYWIEVTDGASTIYQEVNLDVEPVEFFDEDFRSVSVDEGQSSTQNLDFAINGGTLLCDSLGQTNFQPIDTPYGEAFPVEFLLGLSAPLNTRVEFQYEVGGDAGGANPADPFVDFIPASGTLVYEPGVQNCGLVVYVLNDGNIEKAERTGVSLSGGREIGRGNFTLETYLEIRDNEPKVLQFEESYTVSPGGEVTIPVELRGDDSEDVFLSLLVDSGSTLNEEDYLISPSTRGIVVPESENLGFFTVKIPDVLSNSYATDPKLTLRFPEYYLTTGEFEVDVNVNTFKPSGSIESSGTFEFIDLVLVDDWIVLLAINTNTISKSAALFVLDQSGNLVTQGSQDYFDVAKVGVDVIPRTLASSDSLSSQFSAFMEVDGLFADINWQGSDFINVGLEVDSFGIISQRFIRQHGSEGDDLIQPRTSSLQGVSYVYGKTDGSTLDGASLYPSRSSTSGFVYKFDLSETPIYSRFVGDFDVTNVLGVSGSDTGLTVFTEGGGSAKIERLDALGAEDIDFTPYEFGFPTNYDFTYFDSFLDGEFGFAFNALRGIRGAEVADSRTEAGFIYFLRDNQEDITAPVIVDTPYVDEVISIASVDEDDVIGVVGHTNGSLPDNQNVAGSDGQSYDAFIGVMVNGSRSAFSKFTQFGTPGDDFVLSVKPVNDEKFLVLWKENHTSGDGTFRYRITPFAADGTNLAPLF